MTKVLVLEDVVDGNADKRVVFVDGVRMPPDASVTFSPAPAPPGHTAWEWDEGHHRAMPSVDTTMQWENCNFMTFQKPMGIDWETWTEHMQATQFRQQESQAHWLQAQEMMSFTGVVNGPMQPGAIWGTLMRPEDVLKVIPTEILRKHLEERQAAERTALPFRGACHVGAVEAYSMDENVRATASNSGDYWTITGWSRQDNVAQPWHSDVQAYVQAAGHPMEVPVEVLDALAQVIRHVKTAFDARRSALRDLVSVKGLAFQPPAPLVADDEDDWGEGNGL